MSHAIRFGILALVAFACMSCSSGSDGAANDLPITMVAVPAGSFQRDGTTGDISTITYSFKISAHEITTGQFTSVTGLHNPSDSFANVENGPVQYVTWYHAIVFCNELSIAEGLTPAYTIRGSTRPDQWDGSMDGSIQVPIVEDSYWNAVICDWNSDGYRLPTEMEWMWAAMGATSDRSNGYDGSGVNTLGYGKPFAGSTGTNAIGDYAWYDSNSGSRTHTAGSKAANELGLYDMSGNIYEWCWDWYGNNTNSLHQSYAVSGAQIDYRGPDSGTHRVGRGGGCTGSADLVAISWRSSSSSSYRDDSVGFRVVCP